MQSTIGSGSPKQNQDVSLFARPTLLSPPLSFLKDKHGDNTQTTKKKNARLDYDTLDYTYWIGFDYIGCVSQV